MYKPLKQEIVSVLVQNQANVLTRVISMFGRRGFNIDSLTVSPTNNPKLSRITIMFSATEQSMQQIITQTEKLEVVEEVMSQPGKQFVPRTRIDANSVRAGTAQFRKGNRGYFQR